MVKTDGVSSPRLVVGNDSKGSRSALLAKLFYWMPGLLRPKNNLFLETVCLFGLGTPGIQKTHLANKNSSGSLWDDGWQPLFWRRTAAANEVRTEVGSHHCPRSAEDG